MFLTSSSVFTLDTLHVSRKTLRKGERDALSEPRGDLRHGKYSPLVKWIETVQEDPPARYGISVISRRGIINRSNVDYDNVADTVTSEGLDWGVVHVSSIYQHCNVSEDRVGTGWTEAHSFRYLTKEEEDR